MTVLHSLLWLGSSFQVQHQSSHLSEENSTAIAKMSELVIPISPLKVINIQRLLDEDTEECARLLVAAKEEGFFYLDFRQLEDNAAVLRTVDAVHNLQNELFDLPEDEKFQFDVDNLSPMKLNGCGLLQTHRVRCIELI